MTRLLSQGDRANLLPNTFYNFYDRRAKLVGQYKKKICETFADSISSTDIVCGFVTDKLIQLTEIVGAMNKADHAYSGAPGAYID